MRITKVYYKLHINLITATATSLLDDHQSNRLILVHLLYGAKIIFQVCKDRTTKLPQNGFLCNERAFCKTFEYSEY